LAKSEDKAQILGISREFPSIFYPMFYSCQLPFPMHTSSKIWLEAKNWLESFLKDILDLE